MGDLEEQMNKPGFWDDREQAKKVSKRFSKLDEQISVWQDLSSDTKELLELARLGGDDSSLVNEIEEKYQKITEQFNQLEFSLFFSGRYDGNNAILAIHAGAGGVDAQDWVEMLLRMYSRFAEKKDWRTKILSETKGSEAGLKNATVFIEGSYAYGWLKSEAGVHRLVRLSPFDAEQMRHTSFALVEVLPELEEIEVEINPKDLRIDTYLSSGHGGQGVQTTYSAVRIVHLPTGITVTCQNERSQLQNKETAMKILRSKIFKHRQKQQEEEKDRLRGELLSAEWGSQIRSYVLHPYKMVKDHRSGWQTNDPQAVLDGELSAAIEAYLRRSKKSKENTSLTN